MPAEHQTTAKEGLEDYPKSTIILGNLVMALWIVLGTVACWFFYPLAAWIYLPFALLMVFVVLRKLVCTNCYYYGKWCGAGWGKLAALFFKKGNIENYSRSYRHQTRTAYLRTFESRSIAVRSAGVKPVQTAKCG